MARRYQQQVEANSRNTIRRTGCKERFWILLVIHDEGGLSGSIYLYAAEGSVMSFQDGN